MNDVMLRIGILQRIEVWVAGKLHTYVGLEWPVRVAKVSALKLVYFSALGGTSYLAPVMALSIGCLRAATFGDVRAIVWVDVSPAVPWVLLAQFTLGVVSDLIVWFVKANKGRIKFEASFSVSDRLPIAQRGAP